MILMILHNGIIALSRTTSQVIINMQAIQMHIGIAQSSPGEDNLAMVIKLQFSSPTTT